MLALQCNSMCECSSFSFQPIPPLPNEGGSPPPVPKKSSTPNCKWFNCRMVGCLSLKNSSVLPYMMEWLYIYVNDFWGHIFFSFSNIDRWYRTVWKKNRNEGFSKNIDIKFVDVEIKRTFYYTICIIMLTLKDYRLFLMCRYKDGNVFWYPKCLLSVSSFEL